MATSFAIEPTPELVPELDGKKVVFTRADEVEKSDKDDSNQPQTVDAAAGKAQGEKPKAAK